MEVVFALVLLFFAVSLGSLILWKLFDITRNSIKKNKVSYDEEKFDRLAKAFIEYRNATDQRLQNIETILTEENVAAKSRLDTPREPQSYKAPGTQHNSTNKQHVN